MRAARRLLVRTVEAAAGEPNESRYMWQLATIKQIGRAGKGSAVASEHRSGQMPGNQGAGHVPLVLSCYGLAQP